MSAAQLFGATCANETGEKRDAFELTMAPIPFFTAFD